jgi:peptide/nickel transport system substrate-binding protein
MSIDRRTRTAVLAGITLIAVAGCTKIGGSAGRHPYTQAHTLRFAGTDDLSSLNPMTNYQAALGPLSAMTMAYLVRGDKNGEANVPELATQVPSKANGGISADGKTITWHLRTGVVWSDGAPFDANDVVFTTNLVNDPRTNVVSREGYDQIVKVDEPNRYTVVFHLRAPYGPALYTFFSSGPCILPKHLLAGKNVNTDPYNELPVGIGPFKYSAWKRGDSVDLVANPRYWRGLPKLQRAIYKIVPNRNVLLGLLRTHEIDLWGGEAHYINEIRDIPGIKIDLVPSYYYDHLDFNNRHAMLEDPAVRVALRMATDRKALNDKVAFGVYDLGESIVPPVSPFHLNIRLVPFDIAGANALLDPAGWARHSDGIRAKNGQRLILDFATRSGEPDSDERIELMRGWWKQIGVDIVVKHYQPARLFALAQDGGILFSGKFDVALFKWSWFANQDLSNGFACNRFPPQGQNDLFYCNPEIDAIIERGKHEYDFGERMAGMKRLQQLIFDAVPTIVLDARKDIYAYNDDLKGWQPESDAPIDDLMNADI